MSEGEALKAVLNKYQNHPKLKLLRINTGAMKVGSRFIRFGVPGFSDLLGIMPKGRVGFWEAKSLTGRQSPEQKAFQRMVESMGAVYDVFRSLEDFEIILRREGVL